MNNVQRKTGRSASRRRARKSMYRRAWVLVFLLVIALAATAGVYAALLIPRVLDARDSLTAAVPIARGLPAKVLAGDTPSAVADASEIRELATEAQRQTQGAAWRAGEALPFIGGNLEAVRAASEVLADISTYVAEELPTLSIEALKPVDGAVDLSAIHGINEAALRGLDVLDNAEASLADVPRRDLIDQVSSAYESLDSALSRARSLIQALQPAVAALPGLLGEGGARNYLLMVQGNSEVRATGGNPAAMSLLTVADGRVSLVHQQTSIQFRNARADSVVPLDVETEGIYSDIIGRWIPNMTATPHFPTTVEIVQGWWAEEELPPFDSVISVDPVALGYVLAATGPVQLDTGETLTSENAAQILLNQAYFDYDYRRVMPGPTQDEFFALAAARVFEKVMSGIDNPQVLLSALVRATEESRIKLWTPVEAERELIAGTRLSGVMPETNESSTALGVFFNDTTGSKMDYYLKAAVDVSTDQCTTSAVPRYTQTVTLQNVIDRDTALTLPYYIVGRHYTPGDIATDVVLYSPVGGKVESWSVDGAPAQLIAQGTHLGRDVVRLSVISGPLSTATITASIAGGAEASTDAYGPLDVWTTPMVWPTPVTIDAPGCADAD